MINRPVKYTPEQLNSLIGKLVQVDIVDPEVPALGFCQLATNMHIGVARGSAVMFLGLQSEEDRPSSTGNYCSIMILHPEHGVMRRRIAWLDSPTKLTLLEGGEEQ